MSDDEDVALCAAAFIIISESKRRERRFWVRPFLQSRSIYGTNDMLDDLRRDDINPNPNSDDTPISSSFKNFTRISSEDFDKLCNGIAPFAFCIQMFAENFTYLTGNTPTVNTFPLQHLTI